MQTRKQNPLAQTLFKSPFSPDYWRSSRHELISTRMLCTVALLCAVCAVADVFYIPVGGPFLRISFSFLAAAVLCMIGGPLLALPAGFLVDALSFLLSGGDPSGYFPGYAVSSMLAFLVYALFLYHARLSLWRLFCARLTVNVLINVILGSVWKHILYGKAYMVYFVSGAIKNLTMLPVEVLVMTFLFAKLMPVCHSLKLIPKDTAVTVGKRDYIICAVAAVVGIAVLYGYYRYKNG